MRVRAEAELLEAVIALSVAAAEVAVLFIFFFFKGLLQMFDANQRYASLTPTNNPRLDPPPWCPHLSGHQDEKETKKNTIQSRFPKRISRSFS
jgi:hypothetical protein